MGTNPTPKKATKPSHVEGFAPICSGMPRWCLGTASAAGLDAASRLATASWFAAVIIAATMAVHQAMQQATALRAAAVIAFVFATTSWFRSACRLNAARWFAAIIARATMAAVEQPAVAPRAAAVIFATASWFRSAGWLNTAADVAAAADLATIAATTVTVPPMATMMSISTTIITSIITTGIITAAAVSTTGVQNAIE